MRRSRARLAPALLACLVGTLTPAPPSTANAATVPTASCVDGNYFDGLDTRYAATYCKNALAAAGYSVSAFTNTEALPVLEREPTDAVFYHAGHAIVYCESATLCTAISSAFAGTSPSSTTYTGLLGDYVAADFQGPAAVCDSDGRCRNVTLVNYPYTSEMQKFNLAVFQSCESALDGAGGYLSPTTIAYGTGLVGTAIGFKKAVAWIANAPGNNIAGDAFARRFWGDLQSGRSYSSALIDAVTAAGGSTYGYSSYVYRHHSGAPSYLRPAQYYAPGTTSTAVASASAGPQVPADEERSQAVSRALGVPLASLRTSGWRRLDTPTGPIVDTDIAGVGVVQLDARSHELRQVIYEAALDGGAQKQRVSQDHATRLAASFAAEHFAGFGQLAAKRAELLDHGSFTEYRYEWQARSGEAWLPTRVTVSVNAFTGQVAQYTAERVEATAPATPRVTREQAAAAALRIANLGADASAGIAELQVATDSAGQHLVWAVPVAGAFHSGVRIPRDLIVHVDAVDGTAHVWATT